MGGSRGYNSYRGRTPKGKIILAVVLVLVILGAVSFLMLQQYLVYDDTGRAHLELPWQKEETEKDPEQDGAGDPEDDLPGLTIQEPEVTAVYGLQLADAPLTAWTDVAEPYNAAAITVKDSGGNVYFDAKTAAAADFISTEPTTAAVLEQAADTYTIARLCCFLDPKASNANLESMGLKNTGGFIFYDGNNENWLDPGKSEARQYLCDLAKEAAELGFDEILLTDVSYPTMGKLDKIDYGTGGMTENLVTFLEEMRAVLAPYDVKLSIELAETVVISGADETSGVDLAAMAPLVDRIYAPATAEQAEQLAAAVTAANSSTEFVPELTAEDPAWTGGYLRLPE